MLYKEKTTNKKKPHSFEYNVCIFVQRMNGRMEKKSQTAIGLNGNIKQKKSNNTYNAYLLGMPVWCVPVYANSGSSSSKIKTPHAACVYVYQRTSIQLIEWLSLDVNYV